MANGEALFLRTELLLGHEAMDSIARQHVVVFGVGGVGSWCAEALVRSGIGRLTIVDSDCVCASNLNRQLMATTATLGQPKVDVLRRRLLTINPACEITALQTVFCEESAAKFFPIATTEEAADSPTGSSVPPYDYVVDAIDSLKDKALLIRRATQSGCKLYSSMGAALKSDPTRIRVAEFWKVQGDPLARALRKRFKRDGLYPARKFLCVYSDELLANRGADTSTDPEAPRANGTLAHITGIFGFTLAGMVIQDIVNESKKLL